MTTATIPWNSLKTGNRIGQGSYGEVFRGTWQGREVAIKRLELKTLPVPLAKDFNNEVNIMASCNCNQLVKLFGVCTDKDHLALVMELMTRGSLHDVLQNPEIELPWKPLRGRIAQDIAKGIVYLHQKGIPHRYLTSYNILMDEQFQAKISDFGLSKIRTASKSTKTNQTAGSISWLAPEVLKGLPRGPEADIYSFGIVLGEMATRRTPFEEALNDQQIMQWVIDGERETEKIPAECPQEFRALIETCWAQDPKSRPTASQIIQKLSEALIPSHQLIEWKKLDIQQPPLGKGAFGTVHRATWERREVAVKILMMTSLEDSLIQEFKNETRIMAECQCDQIVTLFGICTEEGHYAMVMELMNKGSLYDVLQKEDLPWPQRSHLALDIAKGIAHLHKKKIVHRDLKSLNVLVTIHPNGQYKAKIGDFGLSKIKVMTQSTMTESNQLKGTIRWLAPEIMEGNAKHTDATDIYSFGMTLFELATRKMPFQEETNSVLVSLWVCKGKRETDKIPKECPPEFKALIEACWAEEAKSRPNASKAVAALEKLADPSKKSTPVAAPKGNSPKPPQFLPLIRKFLMLLIRVILDC